MEFFLQQLINGLILGGIYAMIALGYTMVYGILKLINFAHGEILMMGAFAAYFAVIALKTIFPGAPDGVLLVCAFLAAMLGCIVLSLFIERMAYRPLRHAPRLAPLITAIGVSVVLQTVGMVISDREVMSFPTLLPTESFIVPLGGVEVDGYQPALYITPVQVAILIAAASMMLGLSLLVEKTKLGRAMRATSENHEVAGLMGVNVNRIVAITFALGAAMAGVAGVLVAANYAVAHFYMGFIPGIKAFTAAVLGGIGNIYGAMVGGVLLGMIESLGAGYMADLTGGFLGSHYQHVIAFVVLVAVLIFRPTGIMGERVADRV